MSGSFDRPSLRGRAPAEDIFDDPATGPGYSGHELAAPARAPEQDFYPSRSAQVDFTPTNAPIVPAGSVTGRSLTLVISIMCFLACLTAGAVYLINQSASAWLKDIASEVTVQIEPREKVDFETTIRNVAVYLGRQPGVVAAKTLSVDDATALLEPWLGRSDALKSLPVPRLIAVELDRNAPPDLTQLRTA